MANKYIASFTAKLYKTPDTTKEVWAHLLWGDWVRPVPDSQPANNRIHVHARGWTGWVNLADLSEQSLLEVYFIDVGQGDGVLIVTPERKHILIDGGFDRSGQPSGKNAADFVDWKFKDDYGSETMVIDDMIASHCDADHYGGLWDLLNPDQQKELHFDFNQVFVKRFYHAGLSYWKKGSNGKKTLGPVVGGKYTLLAGNKQQIQAALNPNPVPNEFVLAGEWAKFLKRVTDKAETCTRLDDLAGFLPGYDGQGESKVKVKVLGPINVGTPANPALKDLGNDGQNTNGHSILLRLDYGRSRILLTGDLNSNSQKLILDSLKGKEYELACDVAKSCHHGSDDCSFSFLQKINAAVTVISSGDSEGHGHPRPNIVGASAIAGHLELDTKNDELITPMVYSTEISRSYRLGETKELMVKNPMQTLKPANAMDVTYTERLSGGLGNRTRTRPFWDKKLVGGIIYGLVNVRTDGHTILCATMSENDGTWDYKVFKSRFPDNS